MEVAIIDDGVCQLGVGHGKIKASYTIADDLSISSFIEDISQDSHGSKCASIILNETRDIEVVSIKILNG